MTKHLRVIVLLALTSAAVGACSGVVWMGSHRRGVFEELPDTAAVQRIDARGMSRAQLEAVVAEHRVLARVHARLPEGDGRDAALEKEFQRAERVARRAGADAVLYMEDSAVLAAIMQDARYAGPPGASVIYVLRTRGRR